MSVTQQYFLNNHFYKLLKEKNIYIYIYIKEEIFMSLLSLYWSHVLHVKIQSEHCVFLGESHIPSTCYKNLN